MHGIFGLSKGGTVAISVRRLDGQVEIEVRDDGVGMDKEHIEKLLASPYESKTYGSVGLRNIEQRLRRLYRRGLHIESGPGRGTSVRFVIPVSV